MWRDGRLLVVKKGEVFPDRCVKTNDPAQGRRLRQTVDWHHPVVHLAHLATPLAYAAIAAIVARTATFDVGLGDRWRRRRRRATCIALAVFAVSVGVAAYGITLFGRGPAGVWVFLSALVPLLGVFVFFLNGSPLVTAKRISGEYVWLAGVHPDFLAGLPVWPGDPRRAEVTRSLTRIMHGFSDCISPQRIRDNCEAVAAGADYLAFECFCAQLDEARVPIARAVYEKLAAIGEAFSRERGMNPDVWRCLESRVRET